MASCGCPTLQKSCGCLAFVLEQLQTSRNKRGAAGSASTLVLVLLSSLSLSSAIPERKECTRVQHSRGADQWCTIGKTRSFGPMHSGLRKRVCIAEAGLPYSLELNPKMPEDPLRAFFQRLPEGWRAPVINAWSSLLAGLVAYTVATPIEAFKVGIQTWPGSTLAGIGQNILKTRGPGGFFNGLDAMLWAGLPYSLVMYGCYQPVRKIVNEKLQAAGIDPGAYGQFLGAAVAETLGMVVFIPGELVRMRMMNDPGRYSSFIQAVPRIIQKEGVGTMFRGFGTTLARDIPYTALTFCIFENMRAEFARKNGDGSITFSQSMIAGVVTAVLCSTFTIPLDVVKSNVMTSTTGSMASVARDMFVRGGMPAFFKGYLPFVAINAAKWSSSMAVYATAYEFYGGGSMGASVH